MIARANQSWRLFRSSKPGRRFQERYRRRQEREGGWRDPSRLFFAVGGLIIAVGSLLLGVLPGPGTLTFFLGCWNATLARRTLPGTRRDTQRGVPSHLSEKLSF